MDVEFSELFYTVERPFWPRGKSKGPGKRILRGVSGRFQPGQLTALLGPSGAGKSSLLDILAGIRTKGVQGTLLTNGEARDKQLFSRNSCYLMQDDLLQPMLTVGELMKFAAALKLPPSTTSQQRQDKVTEIIDTLNLTECKDTRTESLSGGQRKRLSVGLELINNPPIFFLDEPTSGLDNVSARQCISLLRKLAKEGRTIICSIHQPSALLFQQFDNVYAMSQGLCVYQGPTTKLVSFLESAGLPCPITHNPADFVIEVTDSLDATNVQLLSNSISNGKTIWKGTSDILLNDSLYDKNVRNEKQSIEDSAHCQLPFKSLQDQCNYQTEKRISSLYQFSLLLSRMFLQIRRNKTALWIQLFHHLLCSILIGILFFKRADDGNEVFIHLKCAISIVVFHAYTHVFVPILTYPFAMRVLKREYFNHWYNLGPYYIAQNMAAIPTKIFFSLIFLTIIYFMWGLPLEGMRFFYFCVVGIMISIVAEGLGYVIGSSFSITNGTAIGPACLASMLGLAIYGFDFGREVPLWMSILMQLSFLRLGLVGIIVTIFGDGRGELDCNDTIFGYCHFKDPKLVLYWGGMDTNTVPMEIVKFFGLLFFFRGLFFFTLRHRLMKYRS